MREADKLEKIVKRFVKYLKKETDKFFEDFDEEDEEFKFNLIVNSLNNFAVEYMAKTCQELWAKNNKLDWRCANNITCELLHDYHLALNHKFNSLLDKNVDGGE